jgi:hypothetical protein
VRVLGGAGTGKTVLAMHRAMAGQKPNAGRQEGAVHDVHSKPGGDIEQNLKTLCGSKHPRQAGSPKPGCLGARIHAQQKLEHRIVYDRKQDAALQAWQAAMAVRDTTLDLPDDFYEQELEQVILAQGITTLDEYRTARRTGRVGRAEPCQARCSVARVRGIPRPAQLRASSRRWTTPTAR